MTMNPTMPMDPLTPADSHAIFNQPLAENIGKKQEKANYLKDKNTKKAQVILMASFLALILYSIFFFYSQASAYLQASSDIKAMTGKIDNLQDTVIPNLEATKKVHQSAYDEASKDTANALSVVFPEGQDKLGVVQLLESFATEVGLISPPFEFTSINIGKTVTQEGYDVMPLTTTIHSSQEAFDQFLALVEKSGVIYDETSPDQKVIADKLVRLMSISSISIKYRGIDPETGRDDGVDFNVKLNVYSKIPPEKTIDEH